MEKIKNKKGFLMLRKEIFLNADIKYPDIMVYLALMKFMNNTTKTCFPSIETITRFSRLSKKTVYKSLRKLEKKELISVQRTTGVVNSYTILEPLDPVRKILTNSERRIKGNEAVEQEGVVVVAPEDMVVVAPEDIDQEEIKATNYTKFNDTNIENTNDNDTKNSPISNLLKIEILKDKIIKEDIILAELLEGKIRERMPDFLKVDIRSWADDIRKMRTIDKRNPDQILGAILFSQQDNFWQSVILSAAKVRKHFDKLLAQYQRTGKKKADLKKVLDSIKD